MPQKKVDFGEFELDFGRFQLFRSGQPVRLEGLPLQLLMFLVGKRGQLVTREQIADALWGKDVFVDVEQGINTAIRKIRMALMTIQRSRNICRRSWAEVTASSVRAVTKPTRSPLRRESNHDAAFRARSWDKPLWRRPV